MKANADSIKQILRIDEHRPIYIQMCKGTQNIPIFSFCEAAHRAFTELTEQESKAIFYLYAMMRAPEAIDTEDPDQKDSLIAFVTGVLIGKFLTNTKATIESCEVPNDTKG